MLKKHIFLIIISALVSFPIFAKDDDKKKESEKQKQSEPVIVEKTAFDFDEAQLEGKMKAPSVSILHGRVEQNKSQMVTLRENFRRELGISRSAVRTIRPH